MVGWIGRLCSYDITTFFGSAREHTDTHARGLTVAMCLFAIQFTDEVDSFLTLQLFIQRKTSLNERAHNTNAYTRSYNRSLSVSICTLHSFPLSLCVSVSIYFKFHFALRQCVLCVCVYFMYDLYLNCKQCSDNSTYLSFILCFSKTTKCRQTEGEELKAQTRDLL